MRVCCRTDQKWAHLSPQRIHEKPHAIRLATTWSRPFVGAQLQKIVSRKKLSRREDYDILQRKRNTDLFKLQGNNQYCLRNDEGEKYPVG